MGLIDLVLYEVGVNFLLVGGLLSTALWHIANKYMHGRGQLHEVRQPVEWQYSFDIHCNAVFMFLIVRYAGNTGNSILGAMTFPTLQS